MNNNGAYPINAYLKYMFTKGSGMNIQLVSSGAVMARYINASNSSCATRIRETRKNTFHGSLASRQQ